MSEKRKRAPLTPEEQQYARNLIETYDGVIRQTISRWLNPELRGEFEDVVQSVYEAICVQLNDFGLYQSPQALIITITQRAVWRLHKDRKANKETVPLPDDYPAKPEDRGLGEILPTSTSPLDRRVLTAIYEHRDTEQEVAKDLGKKPAAVRQQVKRARDRLKNSLKF